MWLVTLCATLYQKYWQRYSRRQFVRHQAAYFSYIANHLSLLQGRRTFRDLLWVDVQRYGNTHWRGYVSAHFLQRYEQSGGDLASTWHGYCSSTQLLLLRSAQQYGEQALQRVFIYLAEQVNKQRALLRLWWQLCAPALFVLFLVHAVLLLTILYTAPQLFRSFDYLDDQYLGTYSLALRSLVAHGLQWLSLLWVVLLFVVVLIRWSFANYVGGARAYMDRLQPWRSYKRHYAVHLLSVLGALLPLQKNEQSLRRALDSLGVSEHAWLSQKVAALRVALQAGESVEVAFGRLFLERERQWYLQDAGLAHPLDKALLLCGAAISGDYSAALHQYAVVAKWLTLLSSVAVIVFFGAWHFFVIDEMRTGLLLLHAN